MTSTHPQPTVDVALRTVDGAFCGAAGRHPRSPHLVLEDGEVATYAETQARAQRLAGALDAAGIGRGDRVASLLGNSRELYELYVACGLVGAIVVPCNPMSTERELAAIARDCRIRGLVGEAALLAAIGAPVDTYASALRVVVRGQRPGWKPYEDALAGSEPRVDSSSSPEAAAMIVYSSGTTGAPKGIVQPHGSLVRNAELTLSVLRYGEADAFMSLLPFFSSFGYCWDVLQVALAGARLVVLGRFEPDRAIELIERHRVTCLVGVPTMYVRMFSDELTAGRELSSLRLLDVGGGPVPEALKRRLQESYDVQVVESYGLSEICPVAAVERPERPAPPGSCGPPLPGFEVRVEPTANADAERAGELLFKSDTPMLGYWERSEETQRVLADGWLRTGDLGRVDEEGNVYILDRIKDVIITSGYNVVPKEVEGVLFDHPDVAAAAVVGAPDPVRGEYVHAFVVPAGDSTFDPEAILAHCRDRLALYKVPRRIEPVDELPVTATGKIRRFQLAAAVAASGASERDGSVT